MFKVWFHFVFLPFRLYLTITSYVRVVKCYGVGMHSPGIMSVPPFRAVSTPMTACAMTIMVVMVWVLLAVRAV